MDLSSLDLKGELSQWPVDNAAVIVVGEQGVLTSAGDIDREHPWASVTKIVTALTVLILGEQGVVDLDEPAGPPGATLRHLLAHASGLAYDSANSLARPGQRRIYSSRGYEVVAEHAEQRAGVPFVELLRRNVLQPLGMSATTLRGSPASGAFGPVRELSTLAMELLHPRGLSAAVVAAATTTAFPGLPGVLPGFGRHEHNDWALGCEVRGQKAPHWTAPENSPATYGHFGQAGGFLWVDPELGIGCVSLSDMPFGPWAMTAWPRMSTEILQAHAR